jgi:uncharacterized membrane protein
VFDSFITFVSRFHPLVVHLPIGILLLAALFQWLSRREAYQYLQQSVGIALKTGAFFAVLSCMTGWLLAASGDYEGDTLEQHRWSGIAVAVVSLLACWLPAFRGWLLGAVAVLLAFTGHLGGSMTHGEHFLTEPFSAKKSNQATPVKDLAAVSAYAGVVAPILEAKCTVCHNASKQKGGLRLDSPEWIQKGGKNGPVVVAGDAVKSELMRRIHLPREAEEHMPPKEKPALTNAEIALLEWWIAQGADFEKKAADLPQTDKVKKALGALTGTQAVTAIVFSLVPENPVAPAPAQTLEKLKKAGISVLAVAQNNHYLSVNFVNAPAPPDSVVALLSTIAPQVVSLRLNDVQLPASAWSVVGGLQQLARLHLDGSNISDAETAYLKNLNRLQEINVGRTKLTAQGLKNLSALPNLQKVFFYKNALSPAEYTDIQTAFPKVKIDTGGYIVPVLATDTTKVTVKSAKK